MGYSPWGRKESDMTERRGHSFCPLLMSMPESFSISFIL